jgi:predicted NBD/HSP70 family sugar kinase
MLELIRYRQPITRADLSRSSGLRPSTISAIAGQLLEEGWIREGALQRFAIGRPSALLSVNSKVVTFALDIRPERVIIAVVDLTGRFLTRETIINYSAPNLTVEQIIKQIQKLRLAFPDKSFEGIGISVPGRVDPTTQRILLAPNLRWNEFDLKSALEAGTGLQVEVDNDANACLASELWTGRLYGIRDVVLVAIADGLGTAILASGQLHAGSHGLAGEFGHISIDPTGPVCQCGQRGCWEIMASSRAALRMYYEAGGDMSVRSIYELLRLTSERDPIAVKAVASQARSLGRGLRLITATLDPTLILITGDLTAVWSQFVHLVLEEMENSMLAGPPPELRVAGDSELARLSGSAAMLMQRHSRYHLSTHANRKAIPRSVGFFETKSNSVSPRTENNTS